MAVDGDVDPGGARSARLAACLLACLLAAVACERAGEPEAAAPAQAAEPAYVGSDACAGCHPREAERWRGSHHDLAMQVATPETVLGDFDDASFTHGGVTSSFHRRGERFLVRTDGPDGALGEFEVAYTFGVEPLQQYLLRMPGGRLQALGILWDARLRAEGGQRWYPLYPDEELRPGDPIHWTGFQQTWNHMCAACHSTGVRKGYDVAGDAFRTTFEEIDVACEACHGPGSLHASFEAGAAERPPMPVDLADSGTWGFAEGDPIARRSRARTSRGEIETCGRCHARRALLREDGPGAPLLDTHRVALLERGLYFADGQIDAEVYVHGSFLQSRMHRAGVTCSDCHEPHSLALVVEGGPDAVCSQCHAPQAFASPSHHHHPEASAGASCVACHMPARTYMGVDVRRDHGLRPPRPALAAKLGAPDACSGCHADRSPAWAADAMRGWGFDPGAAGHFAHALRAGRTRSPGAAQALLAVARDRDRAGIVRATALAELGALGAAPDAAALAEALADPDPLVRFGALRGCTALAPPQRLSLARPLLRDPVLSVRLAAEETLRDLDPRLFRPADRAALASVQAEFRAVQTLDADRPEAWLGMGSLHLARGEPDAARDAYERALAIEPDSVAALVNLADLHRALGADEQGEPLLLRAAGLAPESAEVQHALGLLLVRLGRGEEAVVALGRAAELAPRVPRFTLVHALALESVGRGREAEALLEEAGRRFPEDVGTRLTLATRARDRGDFERALLHARALAALQPDDADAARLVEQLEAAAPQ